MWDETENEKGKGERDGEKSIVRKRVCVLGT